MFDIGFWEILLIAVVALVVVGPNEFPGLIRNLGRGVRKVRGFLNSIKSDLDYELDKADEMKRLIEEETKIADLHKVLDKDSVAVPVQGQSAEVEGSKDELTQSETDQEPTQSVGNRRPD
jgi:sec-independent protein translocase protein TatB